MSSLGRIRPSAKANARRLRREMTDAERLLWKQLRHRQAGGLTFRRQHPLGGFIVDFVCLEIRLVIEVDGGQHDQQRTYDQARTDLLNRHGYRVLRFWNNEVLSNLDAVTEALWREVERAGAESSSPVLPPGQGGG